MGWLFESKIYQWVGLFLNIITLLTFIVGFIMIYHNKKTRYLSRVISGGTDETWPLEQKANKYAKTKRYKLFENLKRFF